MLLSLNGCNNLLNNNFTKLLYYKSYLYTKPLFYKKLKYPIVIECNNVIYMIIFVIQFALQPSLCKLATSPDPNTLHFKTYFLSYTYELNHKMV